MYRNRVFQECMGEPWVALDGRAVTKTQARVGGVMAYDKRYLGLF
jgi:hypothetical protein